MNPPTNKIPRDKLFVQVTYDDLLANLWPITLFKVNCEIYIAPKHIRSFSDPKISMIRSRLDRHDILRRIHAPIYNTHKEDPAVLKKAYSESSEFSKMVGAGAIVMHLEYESEKEASFEEWFRNNVEIWRWISQAAEKDQIHVMLENHHEGSAEPIVRILNSIRSDSLKACFDVGHFNVFGKKDVSFFLDDYPKGAIEEIHLSDNLGDSDMHLPLGKGNVDFLKFFEAIDRKDMDPVYTIEAKDMLGIMMGTSYLKRLGRL